jgi:hypothetical protein
MVFGRHGQPLRARIGGRPLGRRPALENAVDLEAEVEVHGARVVDLHHEGEEVLDGARAVTGHLGEAERRAVFGGTAARLYGL